MLVLRLGAGALVATVIAAALPSSLDAPTKPGVREWEVPWTDTRPRDPDVDAMGRVWFVGQAGNYVAYLDTVSGNFDRYEVAEGTHPHNLVIGPDGDPWITGNRNARLVHIDPATRELTTYPMPDPSVRDPHTMVFDQRGNAWFTAQGAGVVGRRDAGDGTIRIWRTGEGTRPYGIRIAPNGHVWVALFGTNKLLHIDPATMTPHEVLLPEGARARRVDVTADGIVWYGDYARGYLGRLDPKTMAITEVVMPSGRASRPYAMAVDHRNRIWLAETGTQPNQLVAYDPATKQFTETLAVGDPAPNTIRHMVFHAAGKAIWFGTDQGTIGRAVVE